MSSGQCQRTMLCILDGFGWREEAQDNAVRLADTPNFDAYFASNPHNFLRTDSGCVGLPEGQFGNSEVGHLNLGAGRVVLQDLPRIDQAIEDGLASRQAVQRFIDAARTGSGRVHLLGLMSPGGVHAHQRHIAKLAKLLAEQGFEVLIHAFLDGRDTPPRSALDFLDWLAIEIGEAPNIHVSTVTGRYLAMDRDNRWDRTRSAYAAIVDAQGEPVDSPREAVERSYAEGVTDEFVNPHIVRDYLGAQDGDAVLCANFRADRVRQILGALALRDFDGFERDRRVDWSICSGMTSYSDVLDRIMDAWVPTPKLEDLLGDVLAAHGKRQLRMAETEKYPHVTFFFNGGKESPAPGEIRIMVPSPRVATYDLQPEMSAKELTERCVEQLMSDPPDFVLVNFANPDMVGHTGDLAAAIQAVETVDHCLGQLVEAGKSAQVAMLVTADHGNCELMRDPQTGGPHTAHTTNPVPIMIINGPSNKSLSNGKLADVAPTILELMAIHQPVAMTGRSLLQVG